MMLAIFATTHYILMDRIPISDCKNIFYDNTEKVYFIKFRHPSETLRVAERFSLLIPDQSYQSP